MLKASVPCWGGETRLGNCRGQFQGRTREALGEGASCGPIIISRARTEGLVQSARPVGAVWALPN